MAASYGWPLTLRYWTPIPVVGIRALKLDPAQSQVWLDGEPVALAKKEFALLPLSTHDRHAPVLKGLAQRKLER